MTVILKFSRNLEILWYRIRDQNSTYTLSVFLDTIRIRQIPKILSIKILKYKIHITFLDAYICHKKEAIGKQLKIN